MKKILPNISIISTLPVLMSVSIAAAAIGYFNVPQLAVPLILGVIAGGLVDLDNRLRGRVKDLGIVLAAFATSSLAVQLTLAHPAAYIAAMLLMTRQQLAEYREFFTPLRRDQSLVRAIDMGILDLEGKLDLIDRDKAAVIAALAK